MHKKLVKEEQIISNANSEGYIPDYSGIAQFNPAGFMQGKLPKFNTKKALKMIEEDPVVKGAIVTFVDRVMESGWKVTGRDQKSRNKQLENKLKELRFNKVLRKAVFNLLLYNNTFIEIVKKGDEVTDLNVLETTLMEIKAKDNGDIDSFEQDVGVTPKPSWTPDKVTFIKLREVTNNVWSEPLDLQSLWDTILIKDFIRQWLSWFFGSNQLRPILALEGANDTRVKELMSQLKNAEANKHLPGIVSGKIMHILLNNFNEGDSILKVLQWCDEQILIALQIPPIAVGKADATGRSNSVEQNASFNPAVKAVQNILEEDITYDLFVKMGFTKNDFSFGILDNATFGKVLEMATAMKNMMMTDEVIQEFFEMQGVYFKEKKLFKTPEELAALSPGNVPVGARASVGGKPMDSAPSRKRQDAQGNSTLSKANSREAVANSKFAQYPYTFEVEKDELSD